MKVNEIKAEIGYLIARDNPDRSYKRCGNCYGREVASTTCRLHGITIGYFGICRDHNYTAILEDGK